MGNRKSEYDLGDVSYKGKLRNQVLTILYIVYLQDILWDTELFITGGAKVETVIIFQEFYKEKFCLKLKVDIDYFYFQ